MDLCITDFRNNRCCRLGPTAVQPLSKHPLSSALLLAISVAICWGWWHFGHWVSYCFMFGSCFELALYCSLWYLALLFLCCIHYTGVPFITIAGIR